MIPSLEEVLARVPQWSGANDLKVTPLGGGITNQNYRVETGEGSFVLRISGANTELLGIDREIEYAANSAAAAIGVAPEVVYFIRPEGYLVTRFVEGRPVSVEEIGRPENIRRVVDALRKVHSLAPIPGRFSPFRVVESYTEIAQGYKVSFPDIFGWLVERMQEIEQTFLRNPFTPRPCHNDLLNGNFLDDGQVRILDWEYAGMGDMFFDLANFAVNHSFSEEQDRFLVECYFREVTPARLARLRLMKAMSDCREAMWGLVQIGISQLDFDFRDYASKHFERLTKRIKNPIRRTWLQEASDGI
jgi:thiamine kinase-like enzyme